MSYPIESVNRLQFNSGGLYYALAKYLGEQVGEAYYQAHGLSVIHLRPGVIAGDGHNPGPQAPDNPTEPWFVYVDPRDVAQSVESGNRNPRRDVRFLPRGRRS